MCEYENNAVFEYMVDGCNRRLRKAGGERRKNFNLFYRNPLIIRRLCDKIKANMRLVNDVVC